MFLIHEVRSIEIDPSQATAKVRYRTSPDDQEILVGRLADALTSDDGSEADSIPVWRTGESVKLRRHGSIVTTLEILTLGKNTLEIRHRGIVRDPSSARRVADPLRKIPGVLEATIDTGKLSLQFDPAVISAVELVRRVETEMMAPPDPHAVPGAERVDFDMANAQLGVSTVNEFVFPAMMPVAATLLVVNNVNTVRGATGQLSEGKIGLPLLYTSIAALTLLNGQFLTAAVMLWCFRSWEQQYRRDLEVENQAMLDEIVGVPGNALAISPEGFEQIVPRSEIGIGQRVRVRAGDRIPVDGKVIAGAALVDEVRLLGDPVPATRIEGDEVLAGSRLLAGELDFSVLRTGSETRAASLTRALIGTTVPAPGKWALNEQAEKFADRTVGPTIIASGLGLLVGGSAMALAIQRPDYATAVGVTAPLETLRAVRIALRHGVLIRSDDALSRLASSSWVILDDHEALQHAECEMAEMQVRGIEEDHLLPALAAAGAWLGDARGPALVRACRARHLIARRAALREIGAMFVTIQYGSHVVRLSSKANRNQFAPLRVELDGVEVARLRFQRTAGFAAASTVRQLQRAGLRVLLISEREASAVATLARRLGVDRFVGDTDADSRRRLLQDLSKRGVRAVHVHVGTRLRDPGDAHLSVAFAGEDETGWRDEDMVLLGQSIASLPILMRLARDSKSRIASLQRWAIMPNLVSVAGAFTLGFSGMTAVFISNFGTSVAYNRARRALRQASLDDTSPPEAIWCTEDELPANQAAIQENDILR
jgi:Cu2+-exporting ATPase